MKNRVHFQEGSEIQKGSLSLSSTERYRLDLTSRFTGNTLNLVVEAAVNWAFDPQNEDFLREHTQFDAQLEAAKERALPGVGRRIPTTICLSEANMLSLDLCAGIYDTSRSAVVRAVLDAWFFARSVSQSPEQEMAEDETVSKPGFVQNLSTIAPGVSVEYWNSSV